MLIYSLRTKILVIVLVFLSLIAAGFISYSVSTTANYKQLRQDGIERELDFETEKVNKIIARLEQGAVFYALGGNFYYDNQSNEIGEKFVIDALFGINEAAGGGFWFEPYVFNDNRFREGFYAFYDKLTKEIQIDNTFFLDEYDYHNKNWYREIFDGIKTNTCDNKIIWTKPYVDDSGTFSLMTTVGAGIYNDDGLLIGVSTIDWEIDNIIHELLEIKPTKNSFVLLYEEDKNLIISDTYKYFDTGESIKNIPWDKDADLISHNDQNYFCFKRYMDNTWVLSVYIPQNEIAADAERRNTRFIVLIQISFLIIFIIAFFVISGFVNAPIKKLTDDVSRIALGNLDTQININSKDEIGLLAKTFNKMTSDLNNSIEENLKEREEKKRINTELAVANSIQASMLPVNFFPERNEFDIYGSMIPAREVGGDFYDFYFLDKDNLAVVIADVSGKGIPAALFMVTAKTLIKNCSSCRTPKTAFETVNKKLFENNDTCIFVTAFMGIYNIPKKRFVYVNAGHNPPLLKRKNGSFEYLKTEPCIILAVKNDAVYNEYEIILEEGDTLFMYTDGITEAMNDKKELFGENRLSDALNKNKDSSVKEIYNAVKNEVDKFAGKAEQTDDIAMLILKITNINDKNQLTIEAEIKNLNSVFEFINKELDKRAVNKEIKDQINIAVEEIFVNIASYAYDNNKGFITITVTLNEKFTVIFEDNGKPYNPLEYPDPDLEKPILERDIGGYGIFMFKKMMDFTEYSRINDKNVLIIAKNL